MVWRAHLAVVDLGSAQPIVDGELILVAHLVSVGAFPIRTAVQLPPAFVWLILKVRLECFGDFRTACAKRDGLQVALGCEVKASQIEQGGAHVELLWDAVWICRKGLLPQRDRSLVEPLGFVNLAVLVG